MPTISARYGKTVALLFVCGISSFYLVGCASYPIEYAPGAKLTADEGLVCGRVRALRYEQPIVYRSDLFSPGGMQVYVMPEDAKVGTPSLLRGDGRFCWHLPPGRYVISSFSRVIGNMFISGRIWAAFTVPAAGSRTCIGTLVIRFRGDRYDCEVRDECDGLLTDWVASALGNADEWQKQLLVLEPLK
jgi:hypothetical protein